MFDVMFDTIAKSSSTREPYEKTSATVDARFIHDCDKRLYAFGVDALELQCARKRIIAVYCYVFYFCKV